MKPDLVDMVLACPVCKAKMSMVVSSSGEDIVDGTLSCHSCNVDYPIVDGIPNLLPEFLRSPA